MRTFLITLATATVVGFSAQAYTLQNSEMVPELGIDQAVQKELNLLPLGQDNIKGVTILTHYNLSGKITGYEAWVDLKDKTNQAVMEFDAQGLFVQAHMRGGAPITASSASK